MLRIQTSLLILFVTFSACRRNATTALSIVIGQEASYDEVKKRLWFPITLKNTAESAIDLCLYNFKTQLFDGERELHEIIKGGYGYARGLGVLNKQHEWNLDPKESVSWDMHITIDKIDKKVQEKILKLKNLRIKLTILCESDDTTKSSTETSFSIEELLKRKK